MFSDAADRYYQTKVLSLAIAIITSYFRLGHLTNAACLGLVNE